MLRISPEKQTDKNTAAVFVAMCLINQRAIYFSLPTVVDNYLLKFKNMLKLECDYLK